MAMKFCSKCGISKDESKFHKKKTGKLRPHCILCGRSYIRDHYRKNKQYYKGKASKSADKFREWLRHLKSTTPCMDCGQQYPYYVMDFDHIDSNNKKYNVSHIVGRGCLAKAREEIQKCELVCSNCHRSRTHKRLCNKISP